MNKALPWQRLPESRSAWKRLLMPTPVVRITIALLITFFPYGIFYSAPYPVSELMTIAAWVWVFPSPIGCLAMAFLPLVMNAAYGYFAFNLICMTANLSIVRAAIRSKSVDPAFAQRAYRVSKACMMLTLALCALQIVMGASFWMSAFPGIVVPVGRGAGLRSEPSLLAGPMMVFLGLLVLRMEASGALGEAPSARSRIFREGMVVMLVLVGMTLSLSVLVAVVAYAPVLFFRGKHAGLRIMGLCAGVLTAIAAFGNRIHDALAGGGGFLDMITLGVASWRNIPDILVLLNSSSYLWPGNPSEVRAKLSGFAVAMNPGLAWLQFTYSTFSACATTAGLAATVVLFFAGLRMGMRQMGTQTGARATWLLLYVANWFLAPKYEACGWVALGLLPWALQWAPAAARNDAFNGSAENPAHDLAGGMGACGAVQTDANENGGLPC